MVGASIIKPIIPTTGYGRDNLLALVILIGCALLLLHPGMLNCMALLVLRHEAFEHLGYFEEVLNQLHLPFIYKDLGDPIHLDGYAGLVVMGGPQSANDSGAALDAERRLISDAVDGGLPVLGICLGAQLIAKVLGARVYKNSVKEIGWAPVHFTERGREDPLFAGLPSPTVFFHWHAETFDLPDGAEWLAYTEGCRNQAFRVGRNVYGIQFHPEITPDMISDWSAHWHETIEPHGFDAAPLAKRVLEAWLRQSGLLAV